jgi:hypothetical protein
MVFACSPAFFSSSSHTSGQTSANGLGRVRQVCGAAIALGNFCCRWYLRAVFSSMSVLAAAAASVLPPAVSCHSFCTCLSLTIASLHA